MTDAPTVIIETPTGTVDASKATLPDTGRTFRDAWRAEGAVIEVDMAAAREIARQQIRQARVPAFSELDADYMRAQETHVDQKAIVDAKNKLRDATADPRIDAAADDTALAAVLDAMLVEIQTIEIQSRKAGRKPDFAGPP
jgi:hypothetical protein